MFEDNFVEMLIATAPQMLYRLLAYYFENVGRYLTKKCFYIVSQCFNWSGFVCIDMSLSIVPKKFLKTSKSWMSTHGSRYGSLKNYGSIMPPAHKPHQNLTFCGFISSFCFLLIFTPKSKIQLIFLFIYWAKNEICENKKSEINFLKRVCILIIKIKDL